MTVISNPSVENGLYDSDGNPRCVPPAHPHAPTTNTAPPTSQQDPNKQRGSNDFTDLLAEADNARNNITYGLYNSENKSDVTFVAGFGSDTWRFPGHRGVLAAANPVFSAMLLGPMAEYDASKPIVVNDVDKRAFEQLLRYLYNEPVNLSSVATARATLEVANKYMCPDLVKQCVVYIDLHLSPSTVLEVIQNLRFFCSRVPTPKAVPSAPPLLENPEEERAAITILCDSLLLNCLLYIDDNASDVLQQEAMEELSFEDISMIAPRDTLKVNSEIDLFSALDRWSISACKRCKKTLTSANRRKILGELSYSPRYLLMTEKEFLSGPKTSELLDLTECDLILRRMKGDRSIKFTTKQEELLKKFASPRISCYIQAVPLSDRSLPRNSPAIDNSINDKIDSKKSKKQKKEEAKKLKKKLKEEKQLDKTRKGCSCSCFGQCLLDVFVFCFD